MNLEFPKLIIGNESWGILSGRMLVLYLALGSIPHTKKEEGERGRNRRKRKGDYTEYKKKPITNGITRMQLEKLPKTNCLISSMTNLMYLCKEITYLGLER